jgi:regulator of protease activity HflC (stomatin/prohibitin superfamily)
MNVLIIVVVVVVVLFLLGMALSARIVKQYEEGVLFRLGRVQGPRKPGFRLIIPLVDVLRRVSLRIVTMPIQSQGIITHDNVSVDVSAVAAASPPPFITAGPIPPPTAAANGTDAS